MGGLSTELKDSLLARRRFLDSYRESHCELLEAM